MTFEILTPSILEWFKDNIKDYCDGNYLEIGVFNGTSIASLGESFPNKKIYGIDPFIEDGNTSHITSKGVGEILINQKENTLNQIKDKSNVVLFETTSKRFVETLNSEKIREMNISAVFIDGAHQYEHVKNDAELALSLIGNKSGIVVFNNPEIPDVFSVINEFEIMLGSRLILKDCCWHGRATFLIKENS